MNSVVHLLSLFNIIGDVTLMIRPTVILIANNGDDKFYMDDKKCNMNQSLQIFNNAHLTVKRTLIVDNRLKAIFLVVKMTNLIDS